MGECKEERGGCLYVGVEGERRGVESGKKIKLDISD